MDTRSVTRLSRAQVLAYRAAVSDLARRRTDPAECRALETGAQDTPPGATAPRALLARVEPASQRAVRELATDDRLAVAHSVRGTMHLHRVADLGLYAAALRPERAAEIAAHQQGQFFADLERAGISPGEAFDEVAAAMREAMVDGRPRTKGELSTAVRQVVDQRLRPWCEGCGVDHVHDGLFRYAMLPAGLTVVPSDDPSMFRFHPLGTELPQVAPDVARREITRRFLRACGPARHGQLAAWLGIAPAAARAMWRLIESVVSPVEVEGARWFAHVDDLEFIQNPPEPPRLRLLPPYDPLTEVAVRELVAPDAAQRKRIWRAVANPGVILRRGEFAGVWRQRTVRHRLVVTLEPFAPLDPPDLAAAGEDADAMAQLAGLDSAALNQVE